MKPGTSVGVAATKLALGTAFLALGVLGVGLIAMAVSLPGAIAKRIAVFGLGVGAIVIVTGYVQTVRNQSHDRST